MSPTSIEDDLRAAFRAAAEAIGPVPQLALPTVAPMRRGARRRWVVPAIAAAVVLAIGTPIVAIAIAKATAGPDIAAASIIQTDGRTASVAGIGFPVPEGWRAAVVGHDATSVTVCVAAAPSPDCAGVTMQIAVPGARGRITPVPSPWQAAEATWCPDAPSTTHLYIQLLDQVSLNGGPAFHYSMSCGPSGPWSDQWFISDGSVRIDALPGGSATAVNAIAAGLDFTGYGHRFGPQIAFVSPTKGPGAASSAALTTPTR